MTTATAFETHPDTGLPVRPAPTFAVGDLVTEHIGSDGYPGVVVHATPKTVWVRSVSFVGNFSPNDAPGWNGYGDSGTIAVDPDDVERQVAFGKSGATKYVHYVSPQSQVGSFNDQDKYGRAGFHPARWHRPGGSFSLSVGAQYRQDPHI